MTGLRALERGRPYAVEGHSNAFGVQITHMMPLTLTARLFERVTRPRKERHNLEGRDQHLHWWVRVDLSSRDSKEVSSHAVAL